MRMKVPNIHRYKITVQYDNGSQIALKSKYEYEVQIQVSPSPQGICTYIRRGISFGKLSRVPTCNIQDAEKLYMPNAIFSKYV